MTFLCPSLRACYSILFVCEVICACAFTLNSCCTVYREKKKLKQVIRVKKTRGVAAPEFEILGRLFLGSEEPSLKLLRLVKLQRTNSSPISNCRRSKLAIFLSCNINSLLRLCRRNAHYIYISDERYIPEVEMKTKLTINW